MKRAILGVSLLLCMVASTSTADILLDVPLYGQEKNNWCWDASSAMILAYKEFDHTQTEIANWAVGGQDVGNLLTLANGGPFTVAGSSPPVTYYKQGCAQVLDHFGPVNSTWLGYPLSLADVQTEMDGRRPALLAVRWLKKGTDVGGHAIVLRGYQGNLISLNDPWPSDNAPAPGHPGVAYLVVYDAMFTSVLFLRFVYKSAPRNSGSRRRSSSRRRAWDVGC